MQRRTKKIFAWSSIFIGTLFLGFPLEAVSTNQLNGYMIIVGILGLVIVVNGVRFLQRIDNPWKPKSIQPKKKRHKRKH